MTESTHSKSRPIPEPILMALRDKFPQLIAGAIEGDSVYLLMADKNGCPKRHAERYVASADFMTAVHVWDSGPDNLAMLCGEKGLQLTLLPGRSKPPRASLQRG